MTAREFQRRLEEAQRFERKIRGELEARDHIAELFGQGQLSEDMRAVIRRVKTRTRYMPDIIAAKLATKTTSLFFVDAKAGDKWKETGNHDIEAAALDGAEKWEEFAECPVYFVFTDGGVARPAIVRANCQPGRFRGVGSGTPFLLVERSICTSFNDVFGQRDAWTETPPPGEQAA